MDNDIYVGTKLKYAISISSQGFDISSDNFTIDLKRGSIGLHFEKDDLIVDNNGQYYVCFDTRVFGEGIIEAIITAFVPDDDFEDGFRTEVIRFNLTKVLP